MLGKERRRKEKELEISKGSKQQNVTEVFN